MCCLVIVERKKPRSCPSITFYPTAASFLTTSLSCTRHCCLFTLWSLLTPCGLLQQARGFWSWSHGCRCQTPFSQLQIQPGFPQHRKVHHHQQQELWQKNRYIFCKFDHMNAQLLFWEWNMFKLRKRTWALTQVLGVRDSVETVKYILCKW